MIVDLENRRILVTGGTGSLGRALVRRLLSGEMGKQMAGDAGADAGEISGADAGSAGASTEKNSDE